MNTDMMVSTDSASLNDTLRIGEVLGAQLRGGEVIELIGDLGSGKTALVRGIGKGIGSLDSVASPSFTISRLYKGKIVTVYHYDFYRLQNPGLMRDELQDSLADPKGVVVVEWADPVRDVLPSERLVLKIVANGEDTRTIQASSGAQQYQPIIKALS